MTLKNYIITVLVQVVIKQKTTKEFPVQVEVVATSTEEAKRMAQKEVHVYTKV